MNNNEISKCLLEAGITIGQWAWHNATIIEMGEIGVESRLLPI